MLATVRILTRAALVLTLGLGAGCSGGGGDPDSAARDREKSKAEWVLVIEDGGAKSELPTEVMNIFLSENDDDPEPFEIVGTGVALAGSIPAAMRVGYGEEFAKLVGKPIPLAANGGDPSEPKSSSVTLNGVRYPVAGGTFTVERLSGKWEGSEGNRTLHGTVELRVVGADGERTVRGTMAVHAVTWG